MEIKIKPATEITDYQQVADLARKIWLDHFVPIIGKDQVDYMLDKFQSVVAITNQCDKDGYQYYQAFCEGTLVGYCAIQPRPDDKIFLSKLYVDKDCRGMGIAQTLLRYIIEEYRLTTSIWLTVNKYNSQTIAVYQKWGFTVVDEMVTDIGNGYVMDDYKMELQLPWG